MHQGEKANARIGREQAIRPDDFAGATRTVEPAQPLFPALFERISRLEAIQDHTVGSLTSLNESTFGPSPTGHADSAGARPAQCISEAILNSLDAAIERACAIQDAAMRLSSRCL